MEDELEGFEYKDEIFKSASHGKAGRCKFFKDKSQIIELSCKVGDIVYETDGIRIYELTILDISLHKNKLYYETKNIDFDDDAIGKSIFLTRQEAEAKLKEVKK